MGTSSAFGGAAGTTPLVPSWLDAEEEDPDGSAPPDEPSDDEDEPAPPVRPPFPPPATRRVSPQRAAISRGSRSLAAPTAPAWAGRCRSMSVPPRVVLPGPPRTWARPAAPAAGCSVSSATPSAAARRPS